jgi:hypothetical protein
MTAYRIEILADLSDEAMPLYILRHDAPDDAEAYASALIVVHTLNDPRMKGWRLVISSGADIPPPRDGHDRGFRHGA